MDNNNEKNQEIILLNNVFYNKPFRLFIFKKLAKISNALYLITDLINDAEPLKWSLRKGAVDSLSFINSVKDISFSVRDVISNLTSIKYLLDLGRTGKIVSEMNHTILEKEIGEIIISLSKEMSTGNIFGEDFFTVVGSENGQKIEEPKGDSYKGQNNNVLYKKEMSFIKKDVQGHKSKEIKDRQKGKRRDEILSIIKSKPNLTIKDISSVIRGCSEKTIQRELISMLSDKLIKKTGERRWSRYNII